MTQVVAGELVELQSTLAGSTWSTASTNLAATSCGGGLVRSGSQYVLIDLFGRVAQARDSSGTLVASATYDVFGVQRTGSGAFAAGIIRKTYGGNNEDGISAFLGSRAQIMGGILLPPPWTPPAGWKICPNGLILPSYIPCPGVIPPPIGGPPAGPPVAGKPPLGLIACAVTAAIALGWYFSDCGWPNPWDENWKTCVGTHWDELLKACKRSARCTLVLGVCASTAIK